MMVDEVSAGGSWSDCDCAPSCCVGAGVGAEAVAGVARGDVRVPSQSAPLTPTELWYTVTPSEVPEES
jgi:hypothetical protein